MPASVWKGFISFGLVSFPVRLAAAARPEAVHFHLLHKKDESRVREVWYCAEENKPIERSDMVRGYEVSKGRYIVVEDEELKKIAPPTATNMDILQFVDSDAVDPIWFETSYYVSPDGTAGKPYTLFAAALSETKQHAIAKLTMHNREHVVLLRPSEDGLLLHTLYYSNELHAGRRAEAPKAKYTPKELELARSLVTHLKAPFKPQQFKDEYRENVERLIRSKQKGKEIKPVEQPSKPKVVDLLEALKQSLKPGAAAKTTGAKSRAAHPARKSTRRKAA